MMNNNIKPSFSTMLFNDIILFFSFFFLILKVNNYITKLLMNQSYMLFYNIMLCFYLNFNVKVMFLFKFKSQSYIYYVSSYVIRVIKKSTIMLGTKLLITQGYILFYLMILCCVFLLFKSQKLCYKWFNKSKIMFLNCNVNKVIFYFILK